MLLTTVSVALFLAMYQAPPPSSDELNSAYTELKDAEGKKDLDLVKKWAIQSSNIARAIIKAPAPTEAGEAEAVKQRLQFAKEVEAYADYALYTASLRAPDKAKMMELFETLEQQSPKSEYGPKLFNLYINALETTGKRAKIMPFAEKAIARDPNNEDMLLVLADTYMNRKNWAQAATFGSRLATVMSTQKQPEGLGAGDWERRRSVMSGRGNWYAGVAYSNLNKYPQADKALRAALPDVKSEPALYSAALFFLGVADYHMAQVTHDRVMLKDALTYSEECAKLASPYAQGAAQNAYAIKRELASFR